MNLEKFGQNFGQKVNWLKEETKKKEETKHFFTKIEQMPRVGS